MKGPSGGTKEMQRFCSHRHSRTHGWKLTSSRAYGSAMCRVRSGLPDSWQLHSMSPMTSACSSIEVLPSTTAWSFSTMSMYSSLALYRTFSRRHGTEPSVACGSASPTWEPPVTAATIDFILPGCSTSSCSMLGSVCTGTPWSSISSSSWYTVTKLSRSVSSVSSRK